MSKAIAPSALFMVAVIGIILLFTITSLSGWIGGADCQQSGLKCQSARTSFCSEWSKSGFRDSEPAWQGDDMCKKDNPKETEACPKPTKDECQG